MKLWQVIDVINGETNRKITSLSVNQLLRKGVEGYFPKIVKEDSKFIGFDMEKIYIFNSQSDLIKWYNVAKLTNHEDFIYSTSVYKIDALKIKKYIGVK